MNNIVPYSGSRNSPIALIGEAPGAVENLKLQPFMGPAGKVLGECLSSAGLIRSDCYMDNIINIKPESSLSEFVVFGKSGVVEKEGFKFHKEKLKSRLLRTSANVIVALGKTATYALIGRTDITKCRGSIYDSTLLPGRKVIPTIHPASVLYQTRSREVSGAGGGPYEYKYIIAVDLQKAFKESKFPEIISVKREYIINPTFKESMEFLSECKNPKRNLPVALDIEVLRQQIYCISFAPNENIAISIPFMKGESPYFSIEEELAIWKSIASICNDKSIKKLGQNIHFDNTFIFNSYNILSYPMLDTMTAFGMLYPDMPKGLDFIASTMTDIPYYKDEGKEYMKIGGSVNDFYLYNAKDSITCQAAWTVLEKDLKEFGIYKFFLLKMEMLQGLVCMQTKGIKVDLEGIAKASEETKEAIKDYETTLEEQIGFEINHRSSNQKMKYFYIDKGIKPYINRKTGKPTVDDSAMKKLEIGTATRHGLKEAGTMRKISKLEKLNSTYLDMKIDSDNRMRGAYNPVGTGSVRISSSKTIFRTGGNMQNLHPVFKEQLVADEDFLLVSIDLANSHDRIVAYIAPEPTLIHMFENNLDIHTYTAASILNKDHSEISDEPGSCYIGNGEYSERFWGKKTNHALKYDMGPVNFALMCEIPIKQAKFLIEAWNSTYPGVLDYRRWVVNLLRAGRTLTDCFGMKRKFLSHWDSGLFREAYSWIPLSTEAYVINYWGISKMMSVEEVEPLNVVHDSLEFQISLKDNSLKRVRECIMEVKSALEQEIKFNGASFRIPTDVEVGFRFKKLKKLNRKFSEGQLDKIIGELKK